MLVASSRSYFYIFSKTKYTLIDDINTYEIIKMLYCKYGSNNGEGV